MPEIDNKKRDWRKVKIILKYDMTMYERVFQILKNKIESGLLPAGSSLPSRSDLCQEFGTSEKTIRRALAMLEEKGFIETSQRRRPVVAAHLSPAHLATTLALKRIDTDITNDVLKTGALLCYPVIKNGISLCSQADLEIPRKILDNMKIGNPSEFWKLSKQFLRFFVARNENALTLQAVDSLGLSELKPLKDDMEARVRYYGQLQEFMKSLETGGAPESVHFDDMSGMYGLTDGSRPAFDVASDSAVLLGRKQLEKLLQRDEVRYSAVYMDIVGLIAAGRYKRGDQLPTHKELQEIYGVSVDTTIKAIQILQEWGVVKTVRGNGIFVEMDKKDIGTVQVPPHLIACHVRRYLDTLELITLTIEGASACTAANITMPELKAVKAEIDRLWNEDYLYERSPAILLDFITEHIGIDALGAIYALLQKNLRIGRSIPGLLKTQKTVVNSEIHEQCVEAAETLLMGDRKAFPGKTFRLYENIYRLVIEECKSLGYYEAAADVYDGTSLWK